VGVRTKDLTWKNPGNLEDELEELGFVLARTGKL